MKKILASVSVFLIALTIGANLKNRNTFDLTEFESEESENHQDGPEEFVKYHKGIRTRSDESKPGYTVGYQMKELTKARAYAEQKLKATTSIQSVANGNGVTAFTERGPANIPGRTRGLLVDPDDATHKTWFVGSAGGGVWKTIDGGTSWQWLTPTIPDMATTTLAMAESNHNVIYAGTGENGFGLVDGVDGLGIIKSTDRGASWNLLPSSSVMPNVNRLAVDPNDEDVILAACSNGIFKSTNGGSSWNKVYTGLVQDLRATPGNFSVMYATENGVGVIKSLDNGDTWNLSNTAMAPTGRIEIAISPVKPNRIIASAVGILSGANSDLYLSDDAGVTWSLVALNHAGKILDYLSSQGWYDNTVAFSPYDKDVVYVGGVGTFQITLGAPLSSTSGTYSIHEINTSSFMSLVSFTNATTGFVGKVENGSAANQDLIEVRFGPGLTQKAHRFWVPDGATSGVPRDSYTYKDYVDVPFQVWDATTNQQLMVSFRDQNRNGIFDLLANNTSATDATLQSREYVFINNVAYDPNTPNPSITTNGGEEFQNMFFFWPVLADGAVWNAGALPASKLQIDYSSLNLFSSTTKSVADVYSTYDGVNNSSFVHPDQHNLYPIKVNDASKTFQLLMSNDGGVFLSKTSSSPGTVQGDWTKVGFGYNTSQFYGADKRPAAQEYFGGMQDNGTWYTPKGTVSSASTYFTTNPSLGGDGFNVLWHSQDDKKMIGGSQYNYLVRTIDGGISWSVAWTGFPLASGSPDNSKFPFITKLVGSKKAPDVIYTVGSDGVWKSTNFGASWNVTYMGSGWGKSSFMNAAVSRANPNIVWAGPGQFTNGNLFVSTDAGASFTKVPNPVGLTLGNITGIATHPLEPNTAYALYSFAQTAKIIKTTDLGQTWNDISGFGSGTSSTNGFPDVAVYCLYVRPDDPNIVWAGTEIGIVESLDGGNSWALLTSFPSVSVWEMKGQDNEIVIATHGRGIWTATLSSDQNGVSKLLASGTSPQSAFKLMVNVPLCDSVVFKFNSSLKAKMIPPDSGTYVLSFKGIPTGAVTIQTFTYNGGIAATSPVTNANNLKLTGYQKTFYDYLTTGNNFFMDGFSVKDFGTSNKSLQTSHNYSADKNLSATLLAPIIVASGGNTSIIYDDVTLVQPGAIGSVFGQKAFNDYVVVEATKDGLNWIPIANGYNSSAQSGWLTAYNAGTQGDISMTATENFDLKTNFQATDTLLVRFRLNSNHDSKVGWGWSIDNIYIQQTPTAVETPVTSDISVYPNPSPGKFTLSYTLIKESEVTVNIWDATGRSISSQSLGNRGEGKNESEFNLEGVPDGVYLARVKTISGDRVVKVMIKK